jgi:hypothetical protein
MPPISTDHILTEYDPDDIVDLATYDRDYTPPPTADPASDHELTTDTYTDTDDSDDDTDNDLGHHPNFDENHSVALLATRPVPPTNATEERPTNIIPATIAPIPKHIENAERTEPTLVPIEN